MNRYDFKTQGKRFVLKLIGALLIMVAAYVISHYIPGWRPKDQLPDKSDLVKINPVGKPVTLNLDRIRWYIGAAEAQPPLQEIGENYKRIRELQQTFSDNLIKVKAATVVATPPGGTNLLTAIQMSAESGAYKNALEGLKLLSVKLVPDNPNLALITSMQSDVSRMQAFREEQESHLEQLQIPTMSTIFWTSPEFMFWEVGFWAVFGVLTNLLVSSVNYLRKGTFRPIEQYVAYTKVIYGPIFAVVLVIALMQGWFDLQGYKVRSVSLPLLGFIFGYAGRKTVELFDRLLNRVLGEAEESIDAGPEAVMNRIQQEHRMILNSLKPRNLLELKEQAKVTARTMIETEVVKKEVKV